MRSTTDTKAQAADDGMFLWFATGSLVLVTVFVGSVAFNQLSEVQRKAIAKCAPNCQIVSPTELIGWAVAGVIAFIGIPLILFIRKIEWRKYTRGDNE